MNLRGKIFSTTLLLAMTAFQAQADDEASDATADADTSPSGIVEGQEIKLRGTGDENRAPELEAEAAATMGDENSQVVKLRGSGHPYAVLCIKNPTNLNIYYSFSWGGENYKNEMVPANGYNWHSWKYGTDIARSPDFRINFDYVLDYGNSRKTYTLKRYKARYQACDQGKGYYFVRKGNHLELYAQ